MRESTELLLTRCREFVDWFYDEAVRGYWASRAFALRRARKVVRGLKEGLSESERYAVADHAVAQLKESRETARSFVAAAKRASA